MPPFPLILLGRLLLPAALLLLTGGCAYLVREEVAPQVPPPLAFSAATSADHPGAARPEPWWHSLVDPELDRLINHALSHNFTLKQAVARLEQARAADQRATAIRYPQLDGAASGSATSWADGDKDQRLTADLKLAWEVDLWQRLSAAAKAAAHESEAARDALQDAGLLVSAQVAETYFAQIEQQQQLALLERQLAVNRAFLELIRLRYFQGESSVVDIYQQRQQLAAISARRPLLEGNLARLGHRLQILLGAAPAAPPEQSAPTATSGNKELPVPAPLPVLGVPSDLLQQRPDLRRQRRRLIAADYRVAEAVADRLPRLRLLGTGGFSGKYLTGDGLFASILADLAAPLADWGYRRSEVERRQGVVAEELAAYTQTFLVALEEVENALALERQHAEHLALLEERLNLAKATLRETRHRYLQGLTDYLPVLTTLQSLQGMEQEILSRRGEQVQARILLHRALGGAAMDEYLFGLPPATPPIANYRETP